MKNRRYALITALATILLITILQTVSAQTVNVSDTLSIHVRVANLTMVDINPANLTWVGINPGEESVCSSHCAPGNKEAIQIENIGSTNITSIWFNVTQPSIMPFGSGLMTNYNPGNFLVLRRNQSGALYYFIDRLEFNESELIYMELPVAGGPSTHPDLAHGRFRSANHEYFWVINISDDTCNDSQFWIGNSPHNQSHLGTVDFTQACGPTTGATALDCRTGYFNTTLNGQWGMLNLTIGGAVTGENYTVVTPMNCSGNNVSVRFWHWNMDAPTLAGGSTAFGEFFRTTALVPGGKDIANVKIRVPYGTMAGNLNTGYLTVIAQATGVDG